MAVTHIQIRILMTGGLSNFAKFTQLVSIKSKN